MTQPSVCPFFMVLVRGELGFHRQVRYECELPAGHRGPHECRELVWPQIHQPPVESK